MVLEHCWGLTDVAIIDIKDSPGESPWQSNLVSAFDRYSMEDTVNSIKVIKHPDVYVYRFPSAEEKRSWFVAVKKATDDYLITRRAERDGAAGSLSVHIDQPSRRLAETASDGAGTAVAGPALAATPPRDTGDPSLSAAQWQWLGNLPDELDVWIAHRQYEPATVEARRGACQRKGL